MKRAAPSRLVVWCLGKLLPPERVDDVLGDLEERARAEGHSRFWYWRQLVLFLVRVAPEDLRDHLDFPVRRHRLGAVMTTEMAQAMKTATRKPGFFLLAAATLALGVGANGALFSLMDAIYFRPLPLEDPERLVRIEATSTKAFRGLISYPESEDIAASVPAFQDVVAVGGRGVTLHQNDESSLLLIDYVSEDFFDVMGIPLGRGDGFHVVDVGTPQVIVNHGLWQERLGGREDIVGSSVQLNDTLFTVMGVTPDGFVGLDRVVRTDVWVMASQARFVVPQLQDEVMDRHRRWFDVYARLAPAATREQARVQLDAVAARWEMDEPDQYPQSGFRTTGFSETRSQRIREGVLFLALPALVLLIACANVANLLLARSEGRRRELAIRTAVGAERWRLTRQLVAESFVLACVGTAGGLVLAAWMIRLFPTFVPPGALTYTLDARFDVRLLSFSAAVLVVSTLLLVAAQVSRVSKVHVAADLKSEGAHAQFAGARFRAQYAIVAAQTAIGAVVLVTTALMVRSLWHSSSLRPGFDRERSIATLYVVPGLQGYDRDATYRFMEDWRERLAAVPGVGRVSYGIRLPAQANEAGWSSDIVIPGVEPPSGEDAFRIRYTMVGPGYFDVMGTRLLRGRGVEATDRPDSEPVVVVNETMAQRFWADGDPIGDTVVMGRNTPVSRTIVGVAEDIKIANLYEPPEMYVYVPYAQDQQGFGLLLLETSVDAESIAAAAAAELAVGAPDVPVLETGSLDRHMKLVLFEERRDAWIAMGVGLLALMLTAGGIYGLVSVVTSYRTREIGIRFVLGASGSDVLRLVIERSLKPAGIGCLVGMGVGLAVTRFLDSRIHGIETNDPVSFVAGTAVLMLAVLVACLVPAYRASRLDPSTMMRYE